MEEASMQTLYAIGTLVVANEMGDDVRYEKSRAL
jgi:hypothetical protein